MWGTRVSLCLIVFCLYFSFEACSASDYETHPQHHRKKRSLLSKRFFWSYASQSHELEKLLDLIVQRLLLADKVALSKWDSKQPIEDIPREEIILQRVVEQAEQSGLDKDWAKLFFRGQIEANKDIQKGLHQQWAERGRPDRPGIDLATEVRPRIDEINASLLTLSKATEQERSQRSCKRVTQDIARNLAFHRYKLDLLHREAFRRGISNICPLGLRG